ncbi:unnamed protein product, partial [Brenthis ino]
MFKRTTTLSLMSIYLLIALSRRRYHKELKQSQTMDTILETTKNNIKVVTFNKPLKKNAIDVEISGNDLTAIKHESSTELLKVLGKFIEAFITFPKVLIAIVNGPAVGIAVTTLAFCDFVFASQNAFFYTPFTKLGIVAEACSTVTFPRLMGERKAMEMLTLNYKMPAKEAMECGFISNVYKAEDLEEKAWEKISDISNLPIDSVLTTKKLIRRVHMNDLLKTNIIELRELERLNKKYSKL